MAKKPSGWLPVLDEMRDFIAEIRDVDYDVVIDAQGLLKTALITYFSGVKHRIGYAHGRELSTLFYTQRVVSWDEYFDHSVLHLNHMASLCDAIGCPPAEHKVQAPVPPPEAQARIAGMLKNAFPRQAPVIAIAMGTQWESKIWPAHHWKQLVDRIIAGTDCNVVLLGAKGDAKLAERLLQEIPEEQRRTRILDLSGQTSIPEMYALYSHVDIAIGLDSAPLHIAGAVHVPHIIGLYGATGYRRTPPFGSADFRFHSTEGELSCQPCHKSVCCLGTTECMQRISPDAVFDNVQQIVRSIGSRHAGSIV